MCAKRIQEFSFTHGQARGTLPFGFLEQQKVKVYGSENVRDAGYWILTELGKEVIRYLEANQQVLDKEGSLSE